jgi:hypothetical protein
MESDEMKRKRVRTPAGPRGNQDQNRPGLARGTEMSQHAARPTRAALVKRLCRDGVRKSRYGRAKGAALTGAGGFMSWTLLIVARQHKAGLLTGALARQNTKEKPPSKDQPVSMPDVTRSTLSAFRVPTCCPSQAPTTVAIPIIIDIDIDSHVVPRLAQSRRQDTALLTTHLRAHSNTFLAQPTTWRRSDDPEYQDDPEFNSFTTDLSDRLFSLTANISRLSSQVALLGTKRETDRVRERVQDLLEETSASFKDIGDGLKKVQAWHDLGVCPISLQVICDPTNHSLRKSTPKAN